MSATSTAPRCSSGTACTRCGRVSTLRRGQFRAMWDDLVGLMTEGVATGRIDTVRPEHLPEAMGRAPRKDDHGGEVYVYRRTGQPCHVCGKKVRTEVLVGRNLFWCPGCQPRFRSRAYTVVKRRLRTRTPPPLPPLGRRLAPHAGADASRDDAGRDVLAGVPGRPDRALGTCVALWPVLLADDAAWWCRWCWPTWCSGLATCPWFIVFVLAVLTGLAVVVTSTRWSSSRTVIGVAVIFVVGFIVLLTSFRRSRLGVAGAIGESMLVDLRDRIMSQGSCPALPPGWYAESALRSAGGTPFAGDFVVASRPGWGTASSSASATSPARGRRRAPGRCCSPVPSAACSPRCHPRSSCPRPTSTSCASTGSRGSRPRSTSRSTWRPATSRSGPPATRRPPSCGPVPAAGRCTSPRGRRSASSRTPSSCRVRGRLDRGDAVLLYTDGMVETRGRDIERASTGCSARATGCSSRASRTAPAAHRHGGHPERRPGPVAGAPALIRPLILIGSGAPPCGTMTPAQKVGARM